MSFQISSLLGSSMSNGHLAVKNDNRASNPEKILHAEIYPDRKPQKCCTLATQIYSIYERNCSSLSDNETRILTAQISQLLPFLNLTQTIGCARSIILNELNGENYTLLENGMLHEHLRNKTHDHDHFCFDYIREFKGFMPIVCVYNSATEESEQPNYFSDAQKSALSDGWHSNDPEITKSKQFRKQYLYVLGLSTMFLIITLCLYLILPELRHNEFDWSLMCHLASLIIGFCCLIAGSNVSNNSAVCVPLGKSIKIFLVC